MSQVKKEQAPAPREPLPTPDEFALWCGLEDRAEVLSQAMMVVVRTLQIREPYLHNINSPLIMAHLMAIQFAKNNNQLEQLVEFDVTTMRHITTRLGRMVKETGDTEYALVGLFDRTICHFGLALDTKVERGKRTWTSPFKNDLDGAVNCGMFDLTEKEVHEVWTVPRLMGYAKDMGVQFRISPWQDDGVITCEVVDNRGAANTLSLAERS